MATIAAITITFNVQRRMKFYSDMLTQAIGMAVKWENYLIRSDQLKVSLQMQTNVPFAKIDGVSLHVISSKLFYPIEALLLYFSIKPVIMLWNN